MTHRLFRTGYCLADESHFLQGGQRGKQIRCPVRAWCFDHPRGRVLFDTGYAAAHLLAAGRRFPYSLYLRATPVVTTPEESVLAQLTEPVDTIVVSHFHADHISGLKDFPQARFFATAEGYADIQVRRGLSALRRAFLPALLPSNFAARATLLGAFTGPELAPFGPTHDLFGDGLLRLVRLPGHARGQLGLLAKTESGTLFLVADAAYSRQAIRENRPPHPVTGLFVDDPRAVRQTLRQLHEFAKAHPDVRLCPTHCGEEDPPCAS